MTTTDGGDPLLLTIKKGEREKVSKGEITQHCRTMSIRREIRLRKEFLHRKQVNVNEMIKLEKKRKIKAAIEQGKAVPTELRNEARELKHEMENDIETLDERKAIDDEYANIGVRDPKVCVTTSRDPSSRLKKFAKEIKVCIPNSQAINRGTYRVNELLEACKKADFTDIVVVNETRGNPDNIVISHLPFGPTTYFTISNSVLRHDIPECTASTQAYPHLIMENLSNTKIGQRICKAIQALFPVPRADSRRIMTFRNDNDYISFRHHTYTKQNGKIVLKENGPRFEMMPYEIRLGTLADTDAEKEWVLRPYMNTSNKNTVL